jgi:hypothetical protein
VLVDTLISAVVCGIGNVRARPMRNTLSRDIAAAITGQRKTMDWKRARSSQPHSVAPRHSESLCRRRVAMV